ncbi:protease inhibitor I42 family protein [Chloroflexota bacterium]
MRLRIILILAMVITLFSVASCITSHDYSVNITCDEFMDSHHESSEFKVEVGDKIRVNLCSNPTTGFKWDYTLRGDDAVKEEDHHFEDPDGDTVGVAGTETWTFEAIKKGTTEIIMEYNQTWDDGIKGEWTCTVGITVE